MKFFAVHYLNTRKLTLLPVMNVNALNKATLNNFVVIQNMIIF